MRGLFHRYFVCLLAVSFILSGLTWRQCAAEHIAPASNHVAVAHNHAAHAQSGHEHQAAAHGMTRDGHADKQPASPFPNDHACQKCCSMCSAAALTPVVLIASAIAVPLPAFFAAGSGNLAGRVLQLDPGIPIHLS